MVAELIRKFPAWYSTLLVDPFLGAFAKFREVIISFVMSVCLSVCLAVRMEHLRSHWLNVH